MDEDTKREIEEIMGNMECPKGFLCYRTGFATLCEAEDVGLKKYIKCLDLKSKECMFSISVGYAIYCECPLRNYLIKKGVSEE